MLSLLLVLLTAVLIPTQVFADSLPEYVSEVKVFLGSTDGSEGYTILSDKNGNPVDLNQNAGGGWGSKGEKAVYLGYKTTSDEKDAVTDLALMNMKGGYSVAEYDAMFDEYIKSQVVTLVQKYIPMLREYRANMNSDNEYNRAKATYVHDALNKFIDDDTGKALGDLFLSATKEELGEAYNALSDEQKKEHADLTTIISQSNGQATLLMQALLVRACDTNADTFTERVSAVNYDSLAENTNLIPTDARKLLAKIYDDDAQLILESWEELKGKLNNYDGYVSTVENYDDAACQKAIDAFEKLDDNASDKEIETVMKEYNAALEKISEVAVAGQLIALHDKLAELSYDGGSMLDFFTRDYAEISDDITVLYPLVSALTDGQRAGLDFVSLEELLNITLTDSEGYKQADFDYLEEESIYAGVDRGIYRKGGVALTSDAMRHGALETAVENDGSRFSMWPYLVGGIGMVSAVCAFGSGISYAVAHQGVKAADLAYKTAFAATSNKVAEQTGLTRVGEDLIKANMDKKWANNLAAAKASSRMWGGLTIGFSVAVVIFSMITVYLSYRDLQEYYNVEFTPIPHYMVDEQDIVCYNKTGEKVMIKNQPAYYKAVECNRAADAEMYKTLGSCTDMNGDVGKQWLALYFVKAKNASPILASSLVAVTGSSEIPANYKTGIHMFGSDAAFNLNSGLYDWNVKAESVYVYYKTDDATASRIATTFTGGTVAVTGGAGLVIGALATALGMSFTNRKKSRETA